MSGWQGKSEMRELCGGSSPGGREGKSVYGHDVRACDMWKWGVCVLYILLNLSTSQWVCWLNGYIRPYMRCSETLYLRREAKFLSSGSTLEPSLPDFSAIMADCNSQGMSPRTPTFYSEKSVKDNEGHMQAPKKRKCCRRRLVNTSSTEPEISVENPDGYVLFSSLCISSISGIK